MTGQKTQSSEVAVGAYVQILKEEEEKYLDTIAKCERKLSVIRQRLKDPARWLNREIREGSLRARAALGEEVPARRSNLPGKTPEKTLSGPEEVIEALRENGFSTSSRYHDDDEEKPKKEKSGFGFFKET